MTKEILGHSPLGSDTAYINQYDAALLYPIPRDLNWQARDIVRSDLPFYGYDVWNGYEVSWLTLKGKPEVRVARFVVPADSPCLIESKSFKLYLNSFNLTRFSAESEVLARMQQDLSAVAGAQVDVSFCKVDELPPIERLQGVCLDDLDISAEHYSPAPELLRAEGEPVAESLYSHLLKSNCPVTGQPDWASVQISYRGAGIDRQGLLEYLISFREHGDFHEQCVETIFMDIWQRCQPEQLSVYARYLRRGGLDINPLRASQPTVLSNPRLGRQ